MDEDVLDIELETYERNRDQLLESAENRFVLIKGDAVIDTFESQMDAIREGVRRFGNHPYLVKQILSVEIPVRVSSSNFEF